MGIIGLLSWTFSVFDFTVMIFHLLCKVAKSPCMLTIPPYHFLPKTSLISVEILEFHMDEKVQPPTSVIDDSQIEIVERINMCAFNLNSILFGMSMLDLYVLR